MVVHFCLMPNIQQIKENMGPLTEENEYDIHCWKCPGTVIHLSRLCVTGHIFHTTAYLVFMLGIIYI